MQAFIDRSDGWLFCEHVRVHELARIGRELRQLHGRCLEAICADPELIHCVRELVPVVEAERAAWFGEELPLGLLAQ